MVKIFLQFSSTSNHQNSRKVFAWKTIVLQNWKFIKRSFKPSRTKDKETIRISGANQSKQILCKTYKSLFAFKADGSFQLASLESRSNCNHCKNPNLRMGCRVCNVKLRTLDHFPGPQKYQFIEKHIDSENHLQMEQILEFYRIYASIRGFDMEC